MSSVMEFAEFLVGYEPTNEFLERYHEGVEKIVFFLLCARVCRGVSEYVN